MAFSRDHGLMFLLSLVSVGITVIMVMPKYRVRYHVFVVKSSCAVGSVDRNHRIEDESDLDKGGCEKEEEEVDDKHAEYAASAGTASYSGLRTEMRWKRAPCHMFVIETARDAKTAAYIVIL